MRVFNFIDKAFFIVAKLAMMTCMILITLNAATRYLLDTPIAGVYEFTEMFLMIMIVFLSVSYTWKLRGYIAITILSDRFKGASRNVVNLLIIASGIWFFGLIGYEAYLSTLEAWSQSQVASGIIPWPIYLSTIWIPVGCGMIIVRMGIELIYGVMIAVKNGFHADMFPQLNELDETEGY